uniref:Uncharacterized protein n=1 Tax=Moniliophthora roreri TaxID=221103 RepID=A0A0W0FLT5_MONRR
MLPVTCVFDMGYGQVSTRDAVYMLGAYPFRPILEL